jgi:hypothetical protein
MGILGNIDPSVLGQIPWLGGLAHMLMNSPFATGNMVWQNGKMKMVGHLTKTGRSNNSGYLGTPEWAHHRLTETESKIWDKHYNNQAVGGKVDGQVKQGLEYLQNQSTMVRDNRFVPDIIKDRIPGITDEGKRSTRSELLNDQCFWRVVDYL